MMRRTRVVTLFSVMLMSVGATLSADAQECGPSTATPVEKMAAAETVPSTQEESRDTAAPEETSTIAIYGLSLIHI